MKPIKHIVLVAAGLLLCACHTQQRVVNHQTQQTAAKKHTAEQVLLASPKIESMQINRMRISIQYAGQQLSAAASMNLIKDSALVISVQPLLGIEVYRLEIDKQEVRLIDKMNRRYCVLSYPELQDKTGLPVEYEDIEAALTQHLFVLGQANTAYLAPLLLDEQEESYRLAFTEGRLSYLTLTDKTLLRPFSSTIGMTERSDFTEIRYENPISWGSVLFPETLTIHYESEQQKADLTLTLQKGVFNEGANVQPLALSRYTLVTPDKLLK